MNDTSQQEVFRFLSCNAVNGLDNSVIFVMLADVFNCMCSGARTARCVTSLCTSLRF